MEINVRLATREDVKGIIDLCNEVFEENTTLDKALESYDQTCNDSNQIYLIGTVDGQIVAHAKATIIPTMYEGMGNYSIINHVCVKEEYRKHHFATKLLDEITKISKEKGCKNLSLWSKNFREAAHACYLNYGFEVVDAKFFEKEI